MFPVLLFHLLLALPVTSQGPAPEDVPAIDVEPVVERAKKPVLQDGPARPPVIGEERATSLETLTLAPRNANGLWLDEKGESSVRITALALLAFATEGSTLRSGPYKREVRQGAKALKDLFVRPKPGEKFSFERSDNDMLQALALYSQARMTSYRILLGYVKRYHAHVFTRERLEMVFPKESAGDPRHDGTRLLYLLLCKQIQIAKPIKKGRQEFTLWIPQLDPKLMKSWLERCRRDTNADPERLLILFLGHLLLDPPKDPPHSAGITGLAWKRAQRTMLADKEKTGKELPPRLLFLDTLLRTEFLSDAFPKELREGRKKRLDGREAQLRKSIGNQKGLSEDDLYLLMTCAMLQGSSSWWKPDKGSRGL